MGTEWGTTKNNELRSHLFYVRVFEFPLNLNFHCWKHVHRMHSKQYSKDLSITDDEARKIPPPLRLISVMSSQISVVSPLLSVRIRDGAP